jgi:hypothetical protein
MRARIFISSLLLLLVFATAAFGQVSVGENLDMNLDGSVSFGYAGSNGNLIQSSHGVAAGGEAELKGSYFDPRFFNFIVSPFYNQSRANSNVQSIFDTSGINATGQFFGGSRYPGSISFGKDWNHEGEFGIPGATAYKSRGDDQYFNVNWGLYLQDLPALSVSYGLGDSSYEVIGTPTQGSSDSKTLSVRSSYLLKGFTLNGGYSNFSLHQHLPNIADISSLLTGTTDQDQWQLGISRRFGRQVTFNSNLSRSHYNAEFSGRPYDQTYDNLASTLNIKPERNLTIVLGESYSDNLAGSLLEPIIDSGGVLQYTTFSESSHSLDLAASATYIFTREFNIQGNVEHRAQSYAGIGVASDSVAGGFNYGHNLYGGSFGAYLGVTHYSANLYNQGETGGSSNFSYARRFGAWAANSSFRYSRNAQTALNVYTQSGYGYGVNISRRLNGWYWTLNANGNESRIDSISNSSSFNHGYSTSFSRRRISFNGSFDLSSGNSIQTGIGLVPVPVPTPVIPSTLLILYGGNSYSGAVGYTPFRGLVLTCDYARSNYHTQNLSDFSRNSLQQFDAKSDWYYRQLHFLGGYSRLLQGFGSSASVPVNVNSFYIGVYRSIRFF